MIHLRQRVGFILVGLAAGLLTAGPLAAQSVLDRTPNLSGGWTGEEGTVYFNFLHRFWKVEILGAGGSEGRVLNSPTFLLGASLPGRVLVGLNYASNSLVDGEEHNEIGRAIETPAPRVAESQPSIIDGDSRSATPAVETPRSAPKPVAPREQVEPPTFGAPSDGDDSSR